MIRAFLIGLVVAVAAVFGPGVASAHAASCSIHDMNVQGWSIQADYVRGHSDFQCGGAENLDFGIHYWLERQHNDGTWDKANCVNTGPCENYKPLTNGTADFWQEGTIHGFDWIFYLTTQVDCRNYRLAAYAVFRNNTFSQVYRGPATKAGC